MENVNSFLIEGATGNIVGGKYFYMTAWELYGVLFIIFIVAVAVSFNLFKSWKCREIKNLEDLLKKYDTDKNL